MRRLRERLARRWAVIAAVLATAATAGGGPCARLAARSAYRWEMASGCAREARVSRRAQSGAEQYLAAVRRRPADLGGGTPPIPPRKLEERAGYWSRRAAEYEVRRRANERGALRPWAAVEGEPAGEGG